MAKNYLGKGLVLTGRKCYPVQYKCELPGELATMPWDKRKTMLAMLYVAAKQDWRIDLRQLVKTIFWADRLHLQKWGELITDDVYKQSKFGPVPDNTCRLVSSLPGDGWTIDLRDLVADPIRNTLTTEKVRYELAESETDALDVAYELFQDMDFDGAGKQIHEIETTDNHIIPLEVLADGDEELIDYLRTQNEVKIALGQ